jgi:hypothetical protein
LRNLPGSLDPTDEDKTVTSLIHGSRNSLRGLGLALGTDDIGLAFLLSPLDNEPRALCILLCNLLLLDGTGELAAERHVGDGHVLEGDVEFLRALKEVFADAVRDLLTLRD